MKKTTNSITTIRLTSDDLRAIQVIQDIYGATSTSGAIRLALRQVAKRAENENPPKK